jgi:hypothetical protein
MPLPEKPQTSPDSRDTCVSELYLKVPQKTF